MPPALPSQKGGAHAQGLGRSRGGLSTKLYAACDALGNPLRLIAGPGQENDTRRAQDLIQGYSPGAVLADRAYDAILEAGAEPVIPPKRYRRHKHAYDRALYQERNRIEWLFNKLKQFRRVATRYDKLLQLLGLRKARRYRYHTQIVESSSEPSMQLEL